jgi:L-iditol 2-dehydrogenase
MKAARLYGPRDLRVEHVADPEPGPGEALIRIEACGVCPSDVRGYLGARPSASQGPRTPGHEWAGVVVALGPSAAGEEAGVTSSGGHVPAPHPAPPLAVGDRVVVDWRITCGTCFQCRRGVFNYCERLERGVRGGFAEYGVAPLSQVYRLPDHVSFEAASFCEPLACVINGNVRLAVELGDDVAIVGAGPIGLLHLQVARSRGARLIVSDPLAARLAAAREIGAHDTIDASAEDPVRRVRDLTAGRGADAVVVAVGAAEPSRQAIEMAAINGRVNFFAGAYPPAVIDLDTNVAHYRQLVVTGSHDFPPHQFATALKLIQHDIVRVTPLVSHRFALEGVQEAFELAAQRRGLKAMVAPAG